LRRSPAQAKFAIVSALLPLAARVAAAGQVLVRSGIEIDRLLAAMADDGDPVSANLPSSGLFVSRLVCVDPVRQHIRVSCAEQKRANSALLAARSVVLRCNHRGARYAFSTTGAREVVHDSEPAIQLALPTRVLAVQHGRTPKQMQVPDFVELDCQVRMGLLAFDAKLIDVGLDGRAFLRHEGVIPLCAGTRLSGARIPHPHRPPIAVDIDVRQVIPSIHEGRRITRIGCQLRAEPADLEELIRLFILDLQ